MPTPFEGSAYRIDNVILGPNDTISSGSVLNQVNLRVVDPDDNGTVILAPYVLFEGTVNEFVFEAEAATFFADGVQIASESPTYEFVNLATNVGLVFGITFSAGGDTYFLPREDQASEGLATVTQDSQIRANGVNFGPLLYGLRVADADEYVGQVFGPGSADVPGLGPTRTIFDTDNIRNNDEGVELGDLGREVVVTVEFSDGNTLDGVNAVQMGQNLVYYNTTAYAFDIAALDVAGYSFGDVAEVISVAATDHDLTYTDLGFVVQEPGDIGGQPGPDPDPNPDPVPVLNFIFGDDNSNRIVGTDGDDAIIAGGGARDRMVGGAGDDVFVFGAEDNDGMRNRDIILDFNAAEDAIFLEEGAAIRSVRDQGDKIVLVLEGDRDKIVIRDFTGDFDDLNIDFGAGTFDIV